MNEPDGFIVEGYARELVPESRRGGGRRIFFIVAGALCGPSVYVLSAHIVAGLGLARAIYAFILGATVSAALGAASAYVGARTRMNVAMLADEAFGYHGGRIVKFVIAVSLVGWVGVILSILGASASDAIQALYQVRVDSRWIAIVAAAVVTVLTLKGVDGLKYIGMLVAPLLGVLLLLLFSGTPRPPIFNSFDAGTMRFGAAVSAVVGEYVVGIVIQPDYGRYVRRSAGAAIGSGTALGIAFPAILILAATASLWCSAPDLVSAMVAVGLGLPALLLVALGTSTDAAACLYSASISLTNDIKFFRLPWVTVGGAMIGCTLAILHAERQFIPFLTLLGIAFPPVAAVNILHVLVALRRHRITAGASSRVAFRWCGLASWLAGSVTGYLSSHGVVVILGIASLDSICVASIIWVSLRFLFSRSSRGLPQDA